MRLRPGSGLATALFLSLPRTPLGQVDYAQYVNPFIGGLGPFEGLACKSSAILYATPGTVKLTEEITSRRW